MNLVRFTFIIGLCFVLLGCSKEPEHSVIIVNELAFDVNRIRLGEVRFKNLKPYTTTTYRTITPGNYVLTGMINGQVYTSDPVTIKGDKGVFKWRLTIESLSRIELTVAQIK
ncbi:MAG: hypothetical protein ACPGSL_09590 [Vicingaceae bacterium]